MNGLQRKKKWVWRTAGAVIAVAIALTGWAYLYDMPGGIADWRYSKAAGYSQTIKIPVGQTPEEAVQKFRRHEKRPVLQRETADGGMLLFYKMPGEEERVNLQFEHVRKTWLGGWKWVMGAGYGLSNEPESEEVLNYMAIPNHKGIPGPFPILLGNVTVGAVESIVVRTESREAGSTRAGSLEESNTNAERQEAGNIKAVGKDVESTQAEVVSYGTDRRIWYAVLPSSATVPYQIEAMNSDGEIIGAASVDDASDFGKVLKNH